MMPNEIENGAVNALSIDKQRKVLKNISTKKTYSDYDWVFEETDDHIDVYSNMCAPLIENIFEGFNATFFAYGQTGSGKTHTMGTADMKYGVLPSALKDIFAKRQELESEGSRVDVELSYIEIYMEDCFDLLCPLPSASAVGKDGERTKLDLREAPGGETMLEGLTARPVNDYQSVVACLEDASKNRSTGKTAMNAQSSRSHAICVITLRIVKEDRVTVSRLNLVDLAGSERAKKTKSTGDTFNEGVSINRGLLALGNVVSALASRATATAHVHVPYR